ncbi:hypothetical protein COL26b_003826 [Colletotrichum chrysophilum]|uniref:uncharacterized protein n=1 Tax=Colletotrichum chrysophilum TaxID=1836956 RepID=UPI002301519F|nr:uncharacterized protein COL26b_003826 [Colletotrichum chrysophilum]KAJ0377911.1 hypothetical protein COL26b_003826 [Colletotrichum chrysophilum]
MDSMYWDVFPADDSESSSDEEDNEGPVCAMQGQETLMQTMQTAPTNFNRWSEKVVAGEGLLPSPRDQLRHSRPRARGAPPVTGRRDSYAQKRRRGPGVRGHVHRLAVLDVDLHVEHVRHDVHGGA